MRILVSGAQSQGKTTFINDFIKAFPMYKKSENSYRELLKDSNIKVNREGSLEHQKLIRDHIIDNHMTFRKTDHVIHDRGILDNVVHTIYLNDKNPEDVTHEFVEESMRLCQETCKFYDIIFLFPITKYDNIPMDEKKNRDTDIEFKNEIDFFFRAAHGTYKDAKTLFFDMKDCPAVIEIFGNRLERIEMARMYIDPKTGDQYKEEKSLLTPDLMDIMSKEDTIQPKTFQLR